MAPLVVLGLKSGISKATITVIAVPVKNSSHSQLAFSLIPSSASQLTISKILPTRKIIPINDNTTIFLIPRVIILSFQKN